MGRKQHATRGTYIQQYTYLYTVQIHQFLGENFTGSNQAAGKTTHSEQALHEVSDKER